MTEIIDATVIVALISSVGAFVKSALTERKTIKKLNAWTSSQQNDIETAAEERRLLMSGMFVILRKIEGEKLNGEVKETIDEMNSFLLAQAHRTKSKND